MSIESAYKDLAHKQFSRDYILKYINRVIEGLEFNFRSPTWVEYLDKLVYDTFGDYRDNLSVFNIRQTAVFVLHAAAYDVKYYSWDPYYLASVSLFFSIQSFFNLFEINFKGKENSLEYISAKTSKENIVNHILETRKLNRESVKNSLLELNEYLENIKKKVKDSNYQQLSTIFNLNMN